MSNFTYDKNENAEKITSLVDSANSNCPNFAANVKCYNNELQKSNSMHTR